MGESHRLEKAHLRGEVILTGGWITVLILGAGTVGHNDCIKGTQIFKKRWRKVGHGTWGVEQSKGEQGLRYRRNRGGKKGQNVHRGKLSSGQRKRLQDGNEIERKGSSGETGTQDRKGTGTQGRKLRQGIANSKD